MKRHMVWGMCMEDFGIMWVWGLGWIPTIFCRYGMGTAVPVSGLKSNPHGSPGKLHIDYQMAPIQ